MILFPQPILQSGELLIYPQAFDDVFVLLDQQCTGGKHVGVSQKKYITKSYNDIGTTEILEEEYFVC